MSLAASLILALSLLALMPVWGLLPGTSTLAVPSAMATESEDADDEVALAVEELAHINALLFKVFRSPDGYAALVGGGIYPGDPLPARFEVAVPAGVEILWFGEILGGPRDLDPTFPEPFDVRTVGNYDIYTAVTNSHVIQIEFLLDYDVTESAPGGNRSVHLSYTPLQDASLLRLAAYIPKDSNVLDPAIEQVGTADQTDEPLYGFTIYDVRAGQTYSIDIVYEPSMALGRQTGQDLAEGLIAVVAAILGTVALAVGFVIYVKSKKNRTTTDDDDYDEDEVEEEEVA